MTFSTASSTDIPVIRELAEKTWWPTYGPLLPKEKIEYLLRTIYSPTALAAAMERGDQEFVLLHDEGLPAGFASYGKHQEAGVFKLHKLYILPATQGKGYGRALIEEVKQRIKGRTPKESAVTLELNVYRGNPALTFYKKLGLVIVGEVNTPVGEYFLEDYVMRMKF